MLLISRCPPFPLYLGDRLIPYHLARQLASRRYHIDLVAYYQNPQDLADIPRYERYFRNIKLIREPQRTIADYYQRLRRPEKLFPTKAQDSWSLEMWKAIENRVMTDRYDIVQLFGGIQVYEFRELIKDLPNIIVPYESYSLLLKRQLQHAQNRIERLTLRARHVFAQRYEKVMFAEYDRVVVLSEVDAQALHTFDPKLPINVIPNGVDTEYFTPTGHEPDQPTLIFTGNFSYPPNVDAAIRLARRIFPAILERVPKARLLLVGSNPPQNMQALATSNIQVVGYVPDMRPYLEQALLYISPLRIGAGIKNKILEAMSMQKPLVATPLSCDGIGLVPDKHVLLAETPEEFVKAVVRLLRDEELRQNMARANRQLVEARFTWRRVADQYEELHHHLIRARGNRV